jgi:hypothetical protein
MQQQQQQQQDQQSNSKQHAARARGACSEQSSLLVDAGTRRNHCHIGIKDDKERRPTQCVVCLVLCDCRMHGGLLVCSPSSLPPAFYIPTGHRATGSSVNCE